MYDVDLKPRNTTATDPRLKKGHVYQSKKDYDRKEDKKILKQSAPTGRRK